MLSAFFPRRYFVASSRPALCLRFSRPASRRRLVLLAASLDVAYFHLLAHLPSPFPDVFHRLSALALFAPRLLCVASAYIVPASSARLRPVMYNILYIHMYIQPVFLLFGRVHATFFFLFLFVLTGYHFRMMSVYLPFLRPLLRLLCSSLRAVSPFRAYYLFVLQRDRPSVYKFKYLYIHPFSGFHLRVSIPSNLFFCSCVYLFCAFLRVFFLVFSARRHFRYLRRRCVYTLRRRLLGRRLWIHILRICVLSVLYSFVFISTLLAC